MDTKDALYQVVGRNIRDARERSVKKLSQEKLAQRLGVSRASVVNIEAGRQHAPLHILWQIAEALDTELVLLLPRREDLVETELAVRLDSWLIRKIERDGGKPDAQKRIAGVVSKLLTTIETIPMTKDTQ
jgi:transcriptional regulator with XRE-family HTH domain